MFEFCQFFYEIAKIEFEPSSRAAHRGEKVWPASLQPERCEQLGESFLLQNFFPHTLQEKSSDWGRLQFSLQVDECEAKSDDDSYTCTSCCRYLTRSGWRQTVLFLSTNMMQTLLWDDLVLKYSQTVPTLSFERSDQDNNNNKKANFQISTVSGTPSVTVLILLGPHFFW